MPASWGEDIDVPAMAWYSSPSGPPRMETCSGEWPATIWIPGAVTSGLMKSPIGPRDENDAMTSGVVSVGAPCAQVAVSPVWDRMKAWKSRPSVAPPRCTVGTQWLSVSVSWFSTMLLCSAAKAALRSNMR